MYTSQAAQESPTSIRTAMTATDRCFYRLNQAYFNDVCSRSEKGEDQKVSNSYWCGDGG